MFVDFVEEGRLESGVRGVGGVGESYEGAEEVGRVAELENAVNIYPENKLVGKKTKIGECEASAKTGDEGDGCQG